MFKLDDQLRPMHSHPNQLDTLHHELQDMHKRICAKLPFVQRVSVVSYDHKSDALKTYAESTLDVNTFSNHEFPLKSSPSLEQCALSSMPRVIDDLPSAISPKNIHSKWLLDNDFKSSYTVPVYNFQHFIGFIFFNSHEKGYFTESVQRELVPYCDLISFIINAEYSLLHAIIASAELTKELSPGYKKESKEHVERISRYAQLIAKEVSVTYQLDDELIENIHLFSRLHDIGKSALSTDILLKPTALGASERDKMKEHVSSGIAIIDKIIENLGSPSHPCIDVLKGIISCHQEFLDGSGYPNGLSHSQIPVPARIITVANIFDALTSHRPYKQACSVASAMLELEKMVCSGKLDGNCVSALREHQAYLSEIIRQFPEQDPCDMH